MIQRNASDRRAGYADGIIAASAALVDDLRERGDISDEEPQCAGCTLAAAGFPFVSQRLDFAHEIASHHNPEE